jgi:hypothetical protein
MDEDSYSNQNETPSNLYRTISEALNFSDSWASLVVKRVLEQPEYSNKDTPSD